MRIVCTFGQYASMRHWGTDRHREYLDRVKTVGKRRSVAMPYAGWVTLSNLLREEAFTKWGKGRPSKLVGDAKGTRSALHCIEKHLSALASHPALRGYAVYGCSEQLFCVWYGGKDRWSLTPVYGKPMRALYPVFEPGVHATTAGASFTADLTRWQSRDWVESYRAYDLFPEDEHLNW